MVIILWLALSAASVLWALTGHDLFGAIAVSLLTFRVFCLVVVIIGLLASETERKSERLHWRLAAPRRLKYQNWDYVLDLGFIVLYGWLADGRAPYAMTALLLYVATVLLWETRKAILEYSR